MSKLKYLDRLKLPISRNYYEILFSKNLCELNKFNLNHIKSVGIVLLKEKLIN